MSKHLLNDKLVAFQRTIIDLEQILEEEKKRASEGEEKTFLELCSVLDSFENIFNTVAEKEEGMDKTARRMLKSFRAIYRKLMRLLEDHGVERIEFPDGKSAAGLCRVVETREGESGREGEIIAIVRHGYRLEQRVLRPAEVITAASALSD